MVWKWFADETFVKVAYTDSISDKGWVLSVMWLEAWTETVLRESIYDQIDLEFTGRSCAFVACSL